MKYILQINLKAENILLSILSRHPESNIIIILIITIYFSKIFSHKEFEFTLIYSNPFFSLYFIHRDIFNGESFNEFSQKIPERRAEQTIYQEIHSSY